jgi:NADH:ubiquinone oxidoreductase subunit F (NADH-binding)
VIDVTLAHGTGAEQPRAPSGAARLLMPTDGGGLAAHVERLGARPSGSRALISEIARSGLRGRGGAGFPTAVKLKAVAGRRRPILVANGTEGEPLSAKDKTLLLRSPHLVLDGLALVAEAVGASTSYVCIDRSATRVAAAVEGALAERRAAGTDRVAVELCLTPTRYVVGEESALVHWLNGGDAKPTTTPPRPFERGVGGRPTVVHNVETLAQVALIARFGADWFRQAGTPAEPGTVLLTVGGAVERPGVYEVGLGSPLTRVLGSAGVADTSVAALLGGYFGTWMPATGLGRALVGVEPLRAVGASLGCGVVWVLPSDACGLAESARIARWFAGESAGQCGPCVNGLPAMASALETLVAGRGDSRVAANLDRWLRIVPGRGACHLPDGAARFVASALATFAPEIDLHHRRGPCPAAQGRPHLPVPHGRDWR